jgi:hypothetical protein
MVELLGLTYNKVVELINIMIVNNLLLYNEKKILNISEHGIKLLKEYNLLDINLNDLLTKNSNIKFSDEKLSINDIFIPKGFDKKFKGY